MFENLDAWGSLPQYLKEIKYETPYTKKIEYAKDKFIHITYTHVWNTGYEYLNYAKAKYFEQAQKDEQLREFLLKEEDRKKEYIKNGGQKNTVIKRIGGKSIELLIDIIAENAVVFRIFEFRTPVPKEKEIKLIKETKRVFVADGKIWSEFPDSNEKFYWEEKNYKKAMNSFLRKKSLTMRIMYGKHKSENPDKRTSRMAMKAYLMSALSKAMGNILVSQYLANWCDFKSTNGKLSKCEEKVLKYNDCISNTEKPLFDCNNNILNTFSKRVVRQNILNGVYVLRYFAKNNISDDVFEYARVFIDSDDFYPCYYQNGILNKCKISREEFWLTENSVNIPLKNTIFNRRYPNVNCYKDNGKMYHIIQMKNYLWAEQLAKIGFQKMINKNVVKQIDKIILAENNYKSTKNMSMNDLFGKKISKRLMLIADKNINIEEFSNYLHFLFSIRDVEDISICEHVAENIDYLHDSLVYISELIDILKGRLTKSDTVKVAKLIIKHFINVEKLNYRNYIIADTYKSINRAFIEDNVQFIRECKKFSKKNKYIEITEEHNRYSALVKCSKMNNVSFAKIKKKYEDIVYENEKYTIIMPTSGNDIVNEGSRMHHCVGGYIDSIIDGRCFILFMRKKENPLKEYVTIEIRNNSICQVKCKNNYVLSSESALNFLEEWIKAKKLKVLTSDIDFKNGKVEATTQSWYGRYLMEEDSVIPTGMKKQCFKTDEEIEDAHQAEWDVF